MQLQFNLGSMVNYDAFMQKFNDTRKSYSKEVALVSNFLVPLGSVRRYILFRIVPPAAIIIIALFLIEKIGESFLKKIDFEYDFDSPHNWYQNARVENLCAGTLISCVALFILGICFRLGESVFEKLVGKL